MKKIALVSLLALACCTNDVSNDVEQVESVTQASHAWSNYRWGTGGPVSVALSRNLTPVWSPFLDVAAVDWSQSLVIDTFVVPGSVNPRTCKPTAGRVEVCNAKYGKNGWLGIASVWANTTTGRITQATVKLNDSYFETAKYNTPDWRMLVTCQEVAHTFGLDHQDEDFANANLGTCMDYTSNPAGPPANTHPNAHDYEELEIIYGGGTLASESDKTAPGRVVQVITHIFPVVE